VALSAANELDQDDALTQLRARVLSLRARIAADQVVIDHRLVKQLPRMYWIEFDFVHYQRQSELDWTERLIEDVESGRIPWPDCEPGTVPSLSIVDDSRESDDDKAS
jgi:hypothetical protein